MTNNYRINLYTIETTDGEKWCAEYPDLPGCVGGGDTPKDALKEAEENKEVYLEFLKEEGELLSKK